MRSETCSVCSQEVRFGRREGGPAIWLHKNDTDHAAILGYIQTDEDRAEIERQLDLPRQRDDGTTYTTREYDLERYRKSKKFREAEEQDDETPEPVEIPAPEVARHDVTAGDFPPRSGIRQIINLVARQGWELRRLTHARGPWVGAAGEVLSISDSVVLGARSPAALDGSVRVAVASWRDGAFFSGYTGTLKDGHMITESTDSKTMKNWIKGNM